MGVTNPMCEAITQSILLIIYNNNKIKMFELFFSNSAKRKQNTKHTSNIVCTHPPCPNWNVCASSYCGQIPLIARIWNCEFCTLLHSSLRNCHGERTSVRLSLEGVSLINDNNFRVRTEDMSHFPELDYTPANSQSFIEMMYQRTNNSPLAE